jgi:glutaredoxin-related protein
MSLIDRVRARAYAALDRAPGKVRDLAHKANEALGRPLADADELAERRAFAAGRGNVTAVAQPAPAKSETQDQAPVLVYFMDKQKRDVGKLTDILDANGITYTVTNIQEDPAAQAAVRRDSRGIRLPVVFVAGDCLGGRTELVNAASSGELKKKVFGG